uniref:INTERNALIN B BINDING, LEUCINE RICH REPEAT.2A n=1 Tax=Siphoviridae sp. ctdcr45 TaxID=2825580 RepID=A0A8S5Q9A0_9CAUD|nr:MAG TPA: INTERNALIN B BINDING, LEUCINE RICH REPEAT.2A [Siphoviridae sp. ctdcr45]
MATLYCRLGTGVESYVVHASYSTATDPYPNGATITTSWTLSYVKDNSTITIRASETECESGYTFPVYVYTSTNGSSWTQVDYLQSGTVTFNVGTGTKYVRVGPATKGSSTSYKVKVVLGTGISQVSYGINTASLTTGPVGSDFTADVKRKSGYVYIGISRIASGYTYPVTATDGSSTWTVINANGTYNDHYISAPSSGGTRTVTLTATKDTRRYYQVHAFANGGKFSDGTTDYYTDLSASATVSVDFDLSTLKTPSRGGYTFKGWGYRSDATQYYTDTIPISATSQDSNDPTIYNLYAIWAKTEYTCYIKIGAGINSASVYVDGALKSDIRDKVYHAITVNYDSTIMVSSIAKATGYARPYIFKFYQTSTSTTPTSTLERDTDTPSYTYSTSRFYAEITATKSVIDLFYWQNATWDAANIKKGQPISNLTAARWNRFKAKIQELATAEGGAYSYASVASGGTIYATEFNGVRTAITGRSGYGTLPAAQSKGDAVKAALFEGSGSLKSALNAAINHYNNS